VTIFSKNKIMDFDAIRQPDIKEKGKFTVWTRADPMWLRAVKLAIFYSVISLIIATIIIVIVYLSYPQTARTEEPKNYVEEPPVTSEAFVPLLCENPTQYFLFANKVNGDFSIFTASTPVTNFDAMLSGLPMVAACPNPGPPELIPMYLHTPNIANVLEQGIYFSMSNVTPFIFGPTDTTTFYIYKTENTNGNLLRGLQLTSVEFVANDKTHRYQFPVRASEEAIKTIAGHKFVTAPTIFGYSV
jgi:hypothetical protein